MEKEYDIVEKASKTGNVLASELKCKYENIAPIHSEMPITKLTKGQSLEVEATAVLGKGRVHAKWSPGHIYYYNEAKVTVNNDDKLLNQMKDKYPPQIFDKSGKIDRNLINTPALIDACEGISKLVEIERKEDSFIFVLESWGQLTPKAIIMEAMNQLDKQAEEIATLIRQSKKSSNDDFFARH